jgi:SRSO17 transposase
MRLPIVQHPSIVINNLPYFASIFQTEEQKKHFCEYVTGLIAGDKKTVTTINGLFFSNNDQSALNKFLTQAEWDVSSPLSSYPQTVQSYRTPYQGKDN